MMKNKHLWKRIFRQYTILILAAFSLVFITISFSMSNAIRKERRATMDQQLESCSSILSARVDEVINLLSKLLNDSTFRGSLQAYYKDGMTASEEERFSRLLASTCDSSWLVDSIYVLDSDFQVCGSSRVVLSEDHWAETFSELARQMQSTHAFRSFFQVDGGLLFLGAIYLDNSYDYVTYLGMRLSSNRMFYNFTSTALKSFQSVYVADGSEIYCQAGAVQDLDIRQMDRKASVACDGVSYTVFSCRNSTYANWTIYALMDESTFYQAIRNQFSMVMGVLLMSILATLVSSLLLSKQITQPLEELSRSFHRLELGEYPPPLEYSSGDEVGQLIQSYNHVVQALKKLNDNIIAEQEEKRQFEIAAIKNRLDLLQSQIQPHFIHNTLNTLNYMAIEGGNTELSQLITSLNVLLRMSISAENDFCTVEGEIDCVNHYLRILRSRYADRPLHFTCTVDEAAKTALLPRLVLQPLVENAIYHGILPIEDRVCTIWVACSVSDGMLCVSVSDDGAGMSEETLQSVLQGKKVPSRGYNSIGIKNVRERLFLLYHQQCEFQIFSRPDEGTEIRFRVPVKR